MKLKTVRFLTSLAKGVGSVTALTSVVEILPGKYAAVGTAIFMGASLLKDFLLGATDLIDDGKANKSAR